MPTANWKRLGELLVRRRIELDPRYSNRRLFADERGLNYRTVSDIERGRRDNYEDATIAAAEVAYGVATGSVARALAGGELNPLAAHVSPVAPVPRNPFAFAAAFGPEPEGDPAWDMFPDPADVLFRWIWRRPVSYEARVQEVGELRDTIRRALEPPGQESAGLRARDGKDLDRNRNFR